MTTNRLRVTGVSRLLVAFTALAAMLAGCGSEPAATGPAGTGILPTGTPAASNSVRSDGPGSPSATAPSGGWSWEDGETATVDNDGVMVAGSPDGPDAVKLEPVSGATETGDPTGDVEVVQVDPCELVQPGEWTGFVGEMAPGYVRLESDDACGWMNQADTLRLAMAVLPYVAEGGRYLSRDAMSGLGGEQVNVSGVASTYLDRWPHAESSTLIVPLEGRDLVLEVSAQDPGGRTTLREMATHFAELAMGRLK